ncbi:MAG TPA: peptidylprolyl isomerase [Bacteroidales bacterium]|nr:peptidylprolyl isomerase [Bacteroidales bacterium]HPS74594.1 peptidylprolyl isomerase [Bacteroidales bacterium]
MKKIGLIILTSLMIMSFSSSAQKSASNEAVKFVIHTDYGDMTGILYNETPQHRDNFVKLVNEGYFEGLLFHRVIQHFMIQGGDPDSRNAKPGAHLGSGGPSYTIPAEFNSQLIHKKGALAAARQGDQVNPLKASSGSQFYIVEGQKISAGQLAGQTKYTDAQKQIYQTIGGTPFLDGAYTVFGEITEGLDVIDKIAAVQKDAFDRPVTDVKMSIKIVK